MNLPTNQFRFNCPCCHTPLTVAASMAGVTGPCPSCQEPVTAPTLVQSPPAVPVSQPAKSRVGMLSGMAAVIVLASGGAWWAKQSFSAAVAAPTATLAAPLPPPSTMAEAIERSSAMVRHFLALSTWPEARALVSSQDITGTLAEPAFQPERFQPLAREGKLTPTQVEELGAPYTLRIVWDIQSPTDASRLTLMSEDTPEGPRVRWHQPPVFLSVVGGTHATIVPEAAPPPPAAASTPPPPAAVPLLDATAEATILAAAQTPETKSSAPLVQPPGLPQLATKATAAVPRAKPVRLP